MASQVSLHLLLFAIIIYAVLWNALMATKTSAPIKTSFLPMTTTLSLAPMTDNNHVRGSATKSISAIRHGFSYLERHANATSQSNNLTMNTSLAVLRSLLVDYPRYLLMPATMVHSKDGPMSTTICTDESPFMQLSAHDHQLRPWLMRLLFAAIYHHQHVPARTAARHRLDRNRDDGARETHNFDYHCPDAKFLVLELSGVGIGANFRNGAAKALIASLVTGRVLLIANTWALASCHRHDYQCIFQPISPCTISNSELDDAPSLNDNDVSKLVRGNRDKFHDLQHERVIRLKFRNAPLRNIPRTVHEILHTTATSLVNEVLPDSVAAPALKVHQQRLRDAADLMLNWTGHDQYHMDTDIFHVLLIYLLRPNVAARHIIHKTANLLWPATFDHEQLLGVPIRASDKCNAESQCLTFEQHLHAGAKSWHNWGHKTNDTNATTFVLVTTESRKMKEAYQNFANGNGASDVTLTRPHFWTNSYDVTPDTGRLVTRTDRLDTASRPNAFAADDAMLSSLTSFYLQLHARVTIGNCCSNFHSMLRSALRVGCGNAHNVFHCLQDDDDPLFAICCHVGDIDKNCAAKRAAALRNRTMHMAN